MDVYEQIQNLNEEINRAEREARANGASRAECHQASADARQQIKDVILEEAAYDFTPAVRDVIWGKAWEDGHSSGYSEILNEAYNLAGFLRDVQKAQ